MHVDGEKEYVKSFAVQRNQKSFSVSTITVVASRLIGNNDNNNSSVASHGDVCNVPSPSIYLKNRQSYEAKKKEANPFHRNGRKKNGEKNSIE